MGAIFLSHNFGSIEKDDLKGAISNLMEHLRYEKGNSYDAGHLGNNSYRIFDERVFNSPDELINYVEDHSGKGASIVAPYRLSKLDDESPKTKRLKSRNLELIKTIDQCNSDHHSYYKDLVQRAKTAKSKTRGCKACGSMIATQHITMVICPVCNNKDFIITATDRKKLESIKAKKDKAENELSKNRLHLEDDLRKRSKLTSQIGWIIAGWCAF